MNTLGPSLDTARQRLEGIGQGHVLAGAASLDQDQLDALLAQINDLDTDKLARGLRRSNVRTPRERRSQRRHP